MIFKKIGNMENVEAICHYLESQSIAGTERKTQALSEDWKIAKK